MGSPIPLRQKGAEPGIAGLQERGISDFDGPRQLSAGEEELGEFRLREGGRNEE